MILLSPIIVIVILIISFRLQFIDGKSDNKCQLLFFFNKNGEGRNWKLPLAGGLAGGFANAVIYPIDTLKTVLQTDKSLHHVGDAILLIKQKGLRSLYSGSITAIAGSIPSSALYFGTYEYLKTELRQNFGKILNRHIIHTIAASSGNIASSFVFVPKETIKQQLQTFKSGTIPWSSDDPINFFSVCRKIVKERGLGGFYPSYRATLARNIPSAIVRNSFVHHYLVLRFVFHYIF